PSRPDELLRPPHRRDRRVRAGDFFFARAVFLFAVFLFFLTEARRFFFAATRSGRCFPPVSRFHSSKVSFEILPSTRSSANLRRCAWLLNGIVLPGSTWPCSDSATGCESARGCSKLR